MGTETDRSGLVHECAEGHQFNVLTPFDCLLKYFQYRLSEGFEFLLVQADICGCALQYVTQFCHLESEYQSTKNEEWSFTIAIP